MFEAPLTHVYVPLSPQTLTTYRAASGGLRPVHQSLLNLRLETCLASFDDCDWSGDIILFCTDTAAQAGHAGCYQEETASVYVMM